MTKQTATGVIDHYWNSPPQVVKYCRRFLTSGNILQT